MLLLYTNQLQFKPNTTDTLCRDFLPPRPLARPNPPNIDDKTSTFIRTTKFKTPILLQLQLAFHPESESTDNGNRLEYKITELDIKITALQNKITALDTAQPAFNQRITGLETAQLAFNQQMTALVNHGQMTIGGLMYTILVRTASFLGKKLHLI